MLPVRPNSRCCSPLDEAGGELAQKHANVAGAPSGDASGPGMGAGADECGSEHGLRRRTGEPGTVGNLCPPSPHQVPMLLRDYARDSTSVPQDR